MDNKDDYLKVNLFDNGMILEELAVSAADLIKSGYKKLDETIRNYQALNREKNQKSRGFVEKIKTRLL